MNLAAEFDAAWLLGAGSGQNAVESANSERLDPVFDSAARRLMVNYAVAGKLKSRGRSPIRTVQVRRESG